MNNTAAPVVHVVAAGEIGGAERMLVDLCRGAERPTSIALLSPNAELRALFRDHGLVVDDRGERVREGPVPFLRSTFGRADVDWLASVLRARGARVVQLHTFASQVLGTRAAALVREGRRLAVVRTEHSTRVYDDPSCWPFSQWSLARADAIVCISEHVREAALRRSLRRATSKRGLRVIHNGVDPHHFTARPPPPRAGLVRFVALGRLDPRKGLDLALEAMTLVPKAALDIVGDGEERGALEGRARALGLTDRVRFLGYRDDVRDAIEDADVVLSSAREEGLGVAILEAMAMARPVVAVPVGGILEIVAEGETGWLADVRSARALARAMGAAIDRPDERERRGSAARARVVARFSVESMRQAYEALYGELTQG